MSEDIELNVLESMRNLATELGAVRATLEAQNKAQQIEAAKRAEADSSRARQDRRRTRLFGLAVAVSLILSGALVWVLIDNHTSNAKLQKVIAQNRVEIAESNRKWCPLLGAIIQPAGPPPSTERSRVMVDLLSDLFVAYGCTPADLPK